jgi:hypothetical protein
MLDVNTPVAGEHVGDIERHVRLIKEKSTGHHLHSPLLPPTLDHVVTSPSFHHNVAQ